MIENQKKHIDYKADLTAEAYQWLASDDELVAVYKPSEEILKREAKTKLCILLFPPMFLFAPFFVPHVRQLTKSAPHLRYVVSRKGIGTYISSSSKTPSSSSNKSGTSLSILDYNLVYNRIGFIHWREILRVDIVKQNNSYYTITFLLKEIRSNGDHGAKNVRLDWVLQEDEDLNLIKKRINNLMIN